MSRITTQSCVTLAAVILLFSIFGCSRGPKPIRPPKVDVEAAAAAAINAYDTSSDGQLDEAELVECPGLLEGIAHYDQDQNGSITADEISQRLSKLYGDGVGILSLGCKVRSRGRPISDCTVRLIPESFLGDALKPAQGKTRESGTAMLRIAPADLPPGLENVRGVQSGVYRAEISHPSPTITKLIEKSGPLGFDVSSSDQVTGLVIELGRK